MLTFIGYQPRLNSFLPFVAGVPDKLIADVRSFFVPRNNDKERYYAYRRLFNQTRDPYQRSCYIWIAMVYGLSL